MAHNPSGQNLTGTTPPPPHFSSSLPPAKSSRLAPEPGEYMVQRIDPYPVPRLRPPQSYVLTSRRAVVVYPPHEIVLGECYLTQVIPSVANMRTGFSSQSQGGYQAQFMGVKRGSRNVSSQEVEIGDVLFMAGGVPRLAFSSVANPNMLLPTISSLVNVAVFGPPGSNLAGAPPLGNQGAVASVQDRARCQTCAGVGVIRCQACAGSGKVPGKHAHTGIGFITGKSPEERELDQYLQIQELSRRDPKRAALVGRINWADGSYNCESCGGDGIRVCQGCGGNGI
jgi:hypothetical protein